MTTNNEAKPEKESISENTKRTNSMESIRVLFVSTMDLTGRSGGNIATKEIAAALARHPRIELSIICPQPVSTLPEEIVENVDYNWHLPEKTSGDIKWHMRSQVPTLRAHIAADRIIDPDLIISRVGPSSIMTPICALATQTPYVALVRGMVDRNLKFGTIIDLIVRANALVATETYVAYAEIADKYRLDDNVTVFPNAVDPERFYAVSKSEARGLINLPVAESDLVVGFVGSLKQRHRVSDLIRAVEQLSDDISVNVLIIGEGPQRDALERQVTDLGLTDAVSFYGHVPHDELVPYIGSCDVTFGVVDEDNPSNPIKCYEYLACERPVITSQTDEFSFISKYDLGTTLESVNPEAIADALRHFQSLNDRTLEEMGVRGRDYILKNHTWERFAESIVTVFHSW